MSIQHALPSGSPDVLYPGSDPHLSVRTTRSGSSIAQPAVVAKSTPWFSGNTHGPQHTRAQSPSVVLILLIQRSKLPADTTPLRRASSTPAPASS